MSLAKRTLCGAAFTLLAALTTPAGAEETARPATANSLMLPPLARNMTRVNGTVRPFFNLLGAGWGAVTDVAVEYYFRSPWKVGVELSPLVLIDVPEGLGAIAHARLRGAFAADYIEVGVGIGGRFQRFGPDGWSIAPAVRFGSLDGLNLRVEIGNSLIRNYYTQRAQFALDHVLGGLDVPVAPRLAITLDGGYGTDLWIYGNLGLKQTIFGDGGPGTLGVGASLGILWVVDRFPCQYGDINPCRGAAWGAGPTIALRVDRRF